MSDEDHQRPVEMWLPLWSKPSTSPELSALFSEGRAQIGGRLVKNGIDFARALAGLGTDRGIAEFHRYGFQQRNGLSYFAVPLGRFKVEPQPQVNLLAEIDGWLDSFRRAASSDNAPSRAQRALRRLESAILELCQQKGPARLQAVLVALGEAEAALIVSAKWRERDVPYLKPVPLLSPQWLVDCDDRDPDRPEFRLSVSLASMYSKTIGDFRQHIEPVRVRGQWAMWLDVEDSSAACNVVWNEGSLEGNLIAVLQRRIVEAVRHGEHPENDGTLVFPDQSLCSTSLGDVGAFLKYDTDDDRIASLLRGLVLLDWGQVKESLVHKQMYRGSDEPMPDATFSLLKLCHTHRPVREVTVRLEPKIARLAAAGRLSDAIKSAGHRLVGSGLSLLPELRTVWREPTAMTHKRIAAALLFPLGRRATDALAKCILKPTPKSEPVDVA